MENIVTDDTIQREQISSATPQAENIKVRFNHQDRFLSPDEAASYAQKGMKLDSLQPVLKELSYLANLRNKNPLETIREYIALDEEINTSLLREQFKDDEVAFNDALQKYKSSNDLKRKELFEEDFLKEKERNFVDEFFELSCACPEIDCFEKIPEAVLRGAEETSLLNSYLKFFHDEQMKISYNNNVEQDNLRAAAGELNGGGENYDSLLSAFIKGLNS